MPPHPETRRASSFVLWGVGLAALVLAVLTIRYFTRERVTITTAKVTYQDLVKTSSTNGKVEPINDFEAHASNAGVVEDIYVSVGQKVQPGQLLLRMDDADAKAGLARAQAQLRAAELAKSDMEHGGSQDERITYASNLYSAKLQLQQDQALLTARQQLQQKGAASPAEVAEAQQRIQADQANIHSVEQHSTQRYDEADRAHAEAQFADAEAAVAAAQSAIAHDDIRSPIAGAVYNIPVARYDYVPAGDNNDLIYVADLGHLQVTAYFDEPEVGNLADGQAVKIVWEAKAAKVWHGHITTAPTTIVGYGQTRSVGLCFIAVDDPTSDLLPNTNVTVTVTIAQHPHALSVPRAALHGEPGQMYVFRVIQNKLVQTPVQVAGGIINDNWAEITGGLAESDTVALGATTNRDLSNGLEVKPVE